MYESYSVKPHYNPIGLQGIKPSRHIHWSHTPKLKLKLTLTFILHRQIFKIFTSSLTAAADFWSAACSFFLSLIFQIFSTPAAPSCAGTPT